MKLRLVYRATWTIAAICTDRGDCPLWEFLTEGVNDPEGEPGARSPLGKERVRLLARLRVIARDGLPRNTAISHQIEPEIWQLEEGRIRVLWFYDQGKMIIVAHGFIKKTQKTPEREKLIARASLKRYRAAKLRGAVRLMEKDDEKR
jgi:phage-related protein